jgi:hypothetical protein
VVAELEIAIAKLEDRVEDLEVERRSDALRIKRIEGALGISAGR